jgi:hypothetical protein
MDTISQDPALTTRGKQERLAEIARTAIAQLNSFESLNAALQQKTKSVVGTGDAIFSAEIRAHVKNSGSPPMTALGMKRDKRAVAAILSAPPFLSGLSETGAQTLRDACVESHEPGVVSEVRELNDEFAICRGVIAAPPA